jgi:uncharacterized membrane-anchored protein YjiN (DUF445 family)
MDEGLTRRFCSTACRVAVWRKTRTATLARLETENAMLRHRITELERLLGLFQDQTENAKLRHRIDELERLVEQTKTQLWARAERRGG